MRVTQPPGDELRRCTLPGSSRAINGNYQVGPPQTALIRQSFNIRKSYWTRNFLDKFATLPILANSAQSHNIPGSVRKLTHEEINRQRLPKDRAPDAPRSPIIGMLDNIRSLYNVGSMFRSADGAFISSLYLCGYTPKPPRKGIQKTALGATKTVPWQFFPSPLEAMNAARAEGARICVLEHTTGSTPYHQVRKADFPICLVVGNEITGISPEVIATADMAIEIPMYGTKQSLNAAVAFGIALFELTRIWKSG